MGIGCRVVLPLCRIQAVSVLPYPPRYLLYRVLVPLGFRV